VTPLQVGLVSAGVGCLAVAAFLIAVPVGLAVAGLALIAAAWLAGEVDGG